MNFLIHFSFIVAVVWATAGLTEPTVFFNGQITTLNDAAPKAEVMVVDGDKLVFVGTQADAKPFLAKPHTSVDLKQRRVLPGFIEAHAHFLDIGFLKLNLDLTNTASTEQIIDLVESRLRTQPEGEWLQGRGWDQNHWPTKEFPTHAGLSKVSRRHPVVLTRIDGHALWCNEKAMQFAKVDKTAKDPNGGKIIRDSKGNPTGVFVDKAMELITSKIPEPGPTLNLKAAELAQQELLSFGITTLHDAGVNGGGIRVFEDLGARKQLNPRLYVMLDGTDKPLLASYFKKGPQTNLYNGHLAIRSIKLLADGALGSRGAALLEPYSDDLKNNGLIIADETEVERVSRLALAHGFQVATHAIGDRANRLVLNAYEAAGNGATSLQSARFRIEHAQIVNPADVSRFVKLGTIASVQPTHCTSDAPWVPARLGDARSKSSAYVWRSFLDARVPLAFGSDAPVENSNPLEGLYAAVTRKSRASGKSSKSFYPEQHLTLLEALKAFTTGGAYAEFAEDKKGKLVAGYLADFIVLDTDIMNAPPEALLSTKVMQTYIDGKLVYARD